MVRSREWGCFINSKNLIFPRRHWKKAVASEKNWFCSCTFFFFHGEHFMLNEKLSSIMLILWFNFILGLNLLSFVLNYHTTYWRSWYQLGRKSCFSPSHRVLKTPWRIQLSSFVTDRGTKPAISTEQAWSIKNYFMTNERTFPCRTYAGNPERERWAHLPG